MCRPSNSTKKNFKTNPSGGKWFSFDDQMKTTSHPMGWFWLKIFFIAEMYEFLTKVIEDTYNSATSVGDGIQALTFTPVRQTQRIGDKNRQIRRNDSLNSYGSRSSVSESANDQNELIITPITSPMTNFSSLTSSTSTIRSTQSFAENNLLTAAIDEDIATWTSYQYRKIVTETQTLDDAVGRSPCCNKNCVSEFTLEEIKNQRYTFHHMNNYNKRIHLNLLKLHMDVNHRHCYKICGKRCCVECLTRVLGISRRFIYFRETIVRNATLNNKATAIVSWLMDLANFSDRMPDREELHIPFINKVIIILIHN
jgi:hypothetical protein